MLSVVVFFGLITTTFGNYTFVLPSSNQAVRSSISTTLSVNLSSVTSNNQTAQGNGASTNLLVTTSFWSSTATPNTPTYTVKENETKIRTISPTSSTQTPNKTLRKRMSPMPATFSATFSSTFSATFSLSATLGTQTKTVGTRTPAKPSKPSKPSKTATEKVFWWHVTTGTLKYLFYGSVGVTLLCVILLIFACCCWRRQTRTLKKLQRQDTTLSNPYSERNNHNVVGFPSPLQLDTFVVKPESPYDMPGQIENPSEDMDISYITVVDGNESDSQYAAVKENGTANSTADSESRDDDSQLSPAYTNASVFENDPYQQLMPDNRSNEDHYTSLINRDENKQENEENEATV